MSQKPNTEEEGIEDEEELWFQEFIRSNPILESEITEMEIKNRIRYSLRYHKAVGLDGISNDMLKYGLEWLAKPLATIFNAILRLEYFPVRWNKAMMSPLHKAGDVDDPTNYRGRNCAG